MKTYPLTDFGKSTCFQLWTDQNLYAKTYTTAWAAKKALLASPPGWVLEVFWGCVSHGIVSRDNQAGMARLNAIVEEEGI